MDFNLKSLLASFCFGIIVFFLFFFFIISVDLPDIPYRFTLYGPVLEEILKFISIIILVSVFSIKPLETLTFGVGYGFAEGLSHFIYPNGNAGLIAFTMHSIVGFVMSYFVYKASGMNKKVLYGIALFLPMFLHAIYNLYLVDLIVYFIVYGS
ncbi:MAG: hypothetical protein WAX44_02770 [Minisyncoccia bacterium]